MARRSFAALPAEAPGGRAAEPDLADYLVYRPAPPARRRFRILRDAGTLRVAGRELERHVDDLDPDDRDDVAALAAELERLGVEPALRAAGARPGDDILVGAHRFTFQPKERGMTRIGVFGGQFDPPHNGHLAVVRAATKQLGLDRVLVVPSARPPHRPARRRPPRPATGWREAAFAGEPGVEVSRIEIDRDGPGYTAKTLEALSGPDRELYLILGADQLAALESWNRPERVRELARLAVAARPGAPRQTGRAARDGAGRRVLFPALRRRIGVGRRREHVVPAARRGRYRRQGLYGRGGVLG